MESELLWRIESCLDGRTGWVCADNGVRITKRISIATCRQIVRVHNHLMEYSLRLEKKPKEEVSDGE